MSERLAIVLLTGCGPSTVTPVSVLRESRVTFTVRALADVNYGVRRWKAGQEVRVDRHLVHYPSNLEVANG